MRDSVTKDRNNSIQTANTPASQCVQETIKAYELFVQRLEDGIPFADDSECSDGEEGKEIKITEASLKEIQQAISTLEQKRPISPVIFKSFEHYVEEQVKELVGNRINSRYQ